MTHRYAHISNRVVANEYAAVAAKVEALYSTDAPLPADTIGPNMRRMSNEVHHRLLGNGWCQRPAQLDCSFESIFESCVHFTTDATFQPVVLRQRDHAAANNQISRATLHQPPRPNRGPRMTTTSSLTANTYISPVLQRSMTRKV